MILSLQKLEFLFNAVQGLWNSELEGLACSLVRRLGRQARGTEGRRCGRMDKAVSQRREKWVGYKQNNKVISGGKRSLEFEFALYFGEGENEPFSNPQLLERLGASSSLQGESW